MVFQGRSIQAKVDLDLQPFHNKLVDLEASLQKLSQGVNIDFGGSKLAHQFEDLKVIMRGVGEEAEKITNAFNKIEGLNTLLDNLSIVKTKLETIQGDVDKINQKVMQSAEVEQEIITLKQQEQNEWKSTLNMAKRELHYLEQQDKAQLKIYEDIIRRYEAEGKLATTVTEQLGILARRNAEEKTELATLDEQLMLQKEINALTMEGGAENLKQAEALLKQLQSDTEIYEVLAEQIALEKEKLKLLEEQDAVLKKQTKDRERQLATSRTGNQLDSPTYLGRRIGSMAVTMLGYQELMDLWDTTTAHINAESQKDYFAKRMNMNAKQTANFNKQLENMQKTYQKLDMTVVGANALETATKYGVQSDSLGDLTEVMAIYGSEFVKQGRSQEDSILAINDALDGELRRLKEVGIGAEELKATGLWSGDESDKEGMLKALLQISKERGYDQTAKDITNLSDAITSLEVRIGIDLARAFGIIEPLLRDVIKDFIIMLGWVEQLSSAIMDFGTNFAKSMGLMDKDGNATQMGNFLESWASWFITFGITAYGVYKILKPLVGVFGKLKDVGGGIAKDTGDIAKTGGTVGKDIEQGGFKSEFKKLGKNLGKMARVFLEVAIAMGMAFVLIEEAIGIISAIGYTYDALKPQFDKGIEFIKEYGLTLALIGGAFIVLSYAIDRVPDSAMESIGKGAVKLGTGMAIAMGLIAEAIVLLNAPLLAIASLGAVQEFAEEQINDGLAVIRMFANALHTIEQDDTIGWFIIGFVGLSAVLGFTADVVAIPLAIGIATTLGLVAEAIGLLVVPLGAIALLGGTASALGEENIKQGAETIRLVGECLKALEPSVRALLLIDLEVFGVNLVDWGNKFITGKTGLQSLVEDIIPNLVQFVRNFNEVDMSGAETVDATKVQAITQMVNDIPPLFNAMNNLNNAMGTSDAIGNIGGALGGGISGAIGMGLKGKLDQLYNDVKDVMDFATKLGGLGSTNGANASAIGQTANAIAQLKAKMDTMVVTINTASVNVRTASKSLGSAIKVGFNEGSSGFNTAVVSVLAKGISEVQHRYDTWHSGGVASAQKLADGFDKLGGKLKASIREEMGYALAELDNYQDDFYNKGVMLGQALVDGFKSKDALDQNSPAKITKSIREELGYSMEALDVGRQMMYRGGQSLGQALASGYDSTGNLMTDVGVLTSKGVSSEQLQANAKNVQVNTKGKQQVPQLTSNTFNIDMSGATIIGIQDLDNKIRQSVEKAIIQMNTPNGAIGY